MIPENVGFSHRCCDRKPINISKMLGDTHPTVELVQNYKSYAGKKFQV